MRPIFFLFTLALLLSSCKSSESVTEQTNSNSASSTTENTAPYKTYDKEELERKYYAQLEEELKIFNEADVAFMTDMIGHHAQALIMSDLAPKNGASESIQILASRIINAQKDEIKLMQTWLRDRKQPVPIVKIEGLNLIIEMEGMDMGEMDHSGHDMDHSNHKMDESGMVDHTGMVGMLSTAQMIELSEAKGKDFDRLFLTYMIQHHQGATFMVRELENSDGAMQHHTTGTLASDINVDQTTEIERMKLMLEEMN